LMFLNDDLKKKLLNF